MENKEQQSKGLSDALHLLEEAHKCLKRNLGAFNGPINLLNGAALHFNGDSADSLIMQAVRTLTAEPVRPKALDEISKIEEELKRLDRQVAECARFSGPVDLATTIEYFRDRIRALEEAEKERKKLAEEVKKIELLATRIEMRAFARLERVETLARSADEHAQAIHDRWEAAAKSFGAVKCEIEKLDQTTTRIEALERQVKRIQNARNKKGQ